MPRDKGKIWEHCERVGTGNKIKCKYCKEEFSCSIARMKFHLGGKVGKDIKVCNAVPDSVQTIARGLIEEAGKKGKKCGSENISSSSGLGSQTTNLIDLSVEEHDRQIRGVYQSTVSTLIRKKEKEAADLAIGRFFIANNIAFNVARSSEFINAIGAVANHGPGYKPPSSETIRTKLLCDLKEEATEYVNVIKSSWVETGCTIMSDGWKDQRNRNHINLLASSIKGTVFLCSETTEGKVKDAKYLADFILRGIDEHVGRENVVQVVTDNASNYNAAGYILEAQMPHAFKTNCAAHCLDLILEDIDREILKVRVTIHKARDIKNFIYKSTHVLDCMRSFTKGKELKRPASTRFATNFLMLESIINLEQSLRFMVASNEWRALSQTKTVDGKEVSYIIQDTLFWEDGREIIAVIAPLVKVLRMVDSEGATLGYVYEAMDRAKEAISKYYDGVSVKYEPYWNIIDKRWADNLHHPIHAIAALLNPHLYYDKIVKHDEETSKGIALVLQQMLTTEVEKGAFSSQMMDNIAFESNIFSSFGKLAIHSRHPSMVYFKTHYSLLFFFFILHKTSINSLFYIM
ncbi:hypothetical protein QJS04_geneDACA017688 [Acorus gramineus]|uniref:BED-type domain-containing protein n=1 Tax=Acorus gramineus TaxID=55184 RepID=A0AAV9BVF0_ACOGR|nr:hypothetical protein QJS04_geneDACA017688 [Acorus gramineus]